MARWSPMDTAPKDGSRVRIRTAFGEDTARWHKNGLWVAGWAPISFNDGGQPTSWRPQTDTGDVADRRRDSAERQKAMSKLKNSDLFLKSIELQWEKEFGS
jgi:hypothetical protein